MPLFYAYIANIIDEATFRLLAIFASPAVADEWWRAVSTSSHARFIKRVAPQFYAHDATQCNLSGFFEMPEFKPIAEMFRGRMLFTQLNDGLLGITIIPPQEVTDHISGGWYHIRSASNHALFWRYDAAENKIRVSEEEPTQFRISIRKGFPEEAILVGEDRITLYIHSQLYVYVEQSGQLKAQAGSPRDFCFRELESGNFAMSEDASVVFVNNADSTLQLMSWELSPALSPSPRETTSEDFDAENLDVVKSSNTALDARVKSLIQEAADARQKSQAAAAAAERELVVVKQQLESSKADLMQERADAEQKLQTAAERSREELNIMKSSKEAIVRENTAAELKSQVVIAVAEMERTYLKQQLESSKTALVQERVDAEQKSQTAAEKSREAIDIIKSSKEALVRENAVAEQKSQAAAAVAERELTDVKRQLDVMKSRNAALNARKKYLAGVQQTLQTAAAAAKRELAVVKRELDVMQHSKETLMQDSADVKQKSQAAEQRLREELGIMMSSKEILVQENAVAEQKSQLAAAAAKMELADVKRQLESSKADLVQERADAEQKLQTAAERSCEELNIMKSSKEALIQENAELKSQVAAAETLKLGIELVKQQLESSRADFMQERADAEKKSQAAEQRSREELARWKQQLKSSKDALVQERADARQKSQTAVAVAERELIHWKQQLDVMKSSKEALDARVECLMQEVADARQKSRAGAATSADRQLTGLRQQLATTKSSNAALTQDSEDAEQNSQVAAVAATVAERKFADVKRQLGAMKSGKAPPISEQLDVTKFPVQDSDYEQRSDPDLCPGRVRSHPSTVVAAADGEIVERILDERKRGRGYQYLVRWVGEGPGDDLWLPSGELQDCEALDVWLKAKGRL